MIWVYMELASLKTVCCGSGKGNFRRALFWGGSEQVLAAGDDGAVVTFYLLKQKLKFGSVVVNGDLFLLL